jgi:hypothetical protein
MTINSKRDAKDSTYRFWSSKDSFAHHAKEGTKKRGLEHELEIDMLSARAAQGSSSSAGPKRARVPVTRYVDDSDDMSSQEMAALTKVGMDALAEDERMDVAEALARVPDRPVLAPMVAPASPQHMALIPDDFATQSDDEAAAEPVPPLARILSYEVVDPNSPSMLRAKDEVIAAKDLALSKCAETIASKDLVIASKDLALSKCAETIASKDLVIAAKDRLIVAVTASNEVVLSKCNEVIRAKDKTIDAMDLALHKSDGMLNAKEETIDAKDLALSRCDDTIRAKDRLIVAKDVAIEAVLVVLGGRV